MAVFMDCPACSMGEHERHVEHWGTRAFGIIDGEFCHCIGDCKERSDKIWEERYGKWGLTE